jgi:hypothetical protein
MHLMDLIVEPDGVTLSHTKVWSNIAYLAGTYKFITADVNADIWLIYLGVVGSAQVASKYLSLKYKGGSINDNKEIQ